MTLATELTMRNLRKGDRFYVYDKWHTASTDAHISGDSTCDEYVVYDEEGEEWFESDFPSEGGTIGNCIWVHCNNTLTIAPIEGTDGMLAKPADGWPWTELVKDIHKVIVKNGVTACRDIAGMFADIANCKKFDIAMLDICGATDMSRMFQGCKSLTDISSVAQWNVGSVEDMSEMFESCISLTNISPLAKWDTRCVTNMSHMFHNCPISDVNPLANWDTKNVANMSGMFCADMSCMFNDRTGLTDVSPLAKWNTENVIDMSGMFCMCKELADIAPLKKWNISNVKNISCLFYCSSIADISPLANWDTGSIKTMEGAFDGCGFLADISPLKKWDVSNVENMSFMFNDCHRVTDISPLKNWNVSEVTNMSHMFSGCTGLTEISPLAKWNTENVFDMSGMFYMCEELIDITPLKKWNISNVKDMRRMFSDCRALTDVGPLANWNTEKAVDMSDMFKGCPVKGFDLSAEGDTTADVAPIHTQDTTNDSVQLERWLVLAREDSDDFIYRFSEFAGMGKDAFRHLYNMKRADVETGSRNPIYDEYHEYDADAEKCEISTYVEYKDSYTDYRATAIAPGSRWVVIMYVGGINYYNSVFLPEGNNVMDSMRKMWVDAYKLTFGDEDVPEVEIRLHDKYFSIESFMPHIGTADVIAFPLTNIENGETMVVRWERTTENEQKNTSIRKEKSDDRYILIAVEKPDCEINHSFHEGKKNAYDAVVEDMLSCTEYTSLEELIDAADAGLCGFDSDGEFWATTRDGHEKHWKIIRV